MDIEALYHALNKPIRMFMYNRTGDWDAARDLTHDVYLKALAATARGNGQSEPGREATWLWQIANNVLRDHIQYMRAPKRWADGGLLSLEDTAEWLCDGGDLAEQTEYRLEWEAVERAMRQLSPEQVTVLRLHLDGWQDAEIGAQCGMSWGAAKAKLHRARANVRELTKHNVSHNAAA